MSEDRADIVDRLRGIADGTVPVPEFSPKDWRPDAIALLLWDAAAEIEALRALGRAAVGPSFAELTDELRHQTPNE